MARALWWSVVCAWAALIFAVSALPGRNIPSGYSRQGHFVEYAVLAVLLFGALRLECPNLRAAVLAVALASAYGVTDEIHQMFVPSRFPDVWDWAVDTLGAACGAACALAMTSSRSRFVAGSQRDVRPNADAQAQSRSEV